MKVLFLDIDGVLNSTRSCVALGGYPHSFYDTHLFDEVAVQLVRRLCREARVQVVLSSTWRQTYDTQTCAEGLDLPIVDCTPVLGGARGFEINAWLARHPEVTRYAIVDDNSDMLPEQRPFFVQTDECVGLTLDDYYQLRRILENQHA